MFKTFAPAEFKHSYIETSCRLFTSSYVTQMQELIQLFKNRNNYYGTDKIENKNKALEYFSEQSWGCKKLLSTYAENEETAWTQILGSKDIDPKDLDATVRWLRYEVEQKKGEFLFRINNYSRWETLDTDDKKSKAKIVEKAIKNLNTSLKVFDLLKKYNQ